MVGVWVIVINVEFNGCNINDGCGLIYFDLLWVVVFVYWVDLGLVYDGDVDWCLVVDVNGDFVDGDVIMVVLVLVMKEVGELVCNILVVIVMSNFGLYLVMCLVGVIVCIIVVGDCYVFEELWVGDYSFGGE